VALFLPESPIPSSHPKPLPRSYAKYIFKSQNTLVKQWLKQWFSRYPMLPLETRGYEFSIEHGLRKQSTFRPLQSLLTSGLIVLILWGLNNTHDSYALFQKMRPAPSFPPTPWLSPLAVKSAESPREAAWLHLRIQAGDNLSRIFEKYKLNKAHLHQLTQLDKNADKLLQLNINQPLHIKSDSRGNIENLILELEATHELYIYRQQEKFKSEVRKIARQTDFITRQASVGNSLKVAATQAGLSESMRNNLENIFTWEIDFQRLRTQDSFRVINEQHWFEGEAKEGDILAAEFVHQGEIYQAVRYTDHSGNTDYYTPDGVSLSKIMLLMPVEFTRISSFFGERQHPIINMFRFHTGIDYAAPRGAPVRAVSDATVIFVGYKGGYGNTVILEHHNRLQTLYAHLSEFTENLSLGEHLLPGQIIGYVGQTGLATGPHLHYEVQLDGLPIDPLLTYLPLFIPIPEDEREAFFTQSQPLVAKLAMIPSLPIGTENLAMKFPP